MSRQTIKTLAEEIRRRWPWLEVKVERGYCNTDRKWKGSRLRHPGKGRYAARLIVRNPRVRDNPGRPFGVPSAQLLIDHNNAETYRTTGEVREWIDRCVKLGRPIGAREFFR